MNFLKDVFGEVVDFGELQATPEWLTVLDSFEVMRYQKIYS